MQISLLWGNENMIWVWSHNTRTIIVTKWESKYLNWMFVNPTKAQRRCLYLCAGVCFLWLPCFCVVCGQRHLSPGCPSLSSGLNSHTHTPFSDVGHVFHNWEIFNVSVNYVYQCVSLAGVGLDFGPLWGMCYLSDYSVINKVHPSLSLLLSVPVSPSSLCIMAYYPVVTSSVRAKVWWLRHKFRKIIYYYYYY